jgi:hypothetical protein
LDQIRCSPVSSYNQFLEQINQKLNLWSHLVNCDEQSGPSFHGGKLGAGAIDGGSNGDDLPSDMPSTIEEEK